MSVHKQLAKIEKLRIAYMNGTRRKLMRKEIKEWKKLLKGDSRNMSSGRKSVFNRAKKYAADILKKLGFEVLLLVLSSMNRTQLAAYHMKEQLLEALGKWWNTVSHPPALNDAAKCLDIDDEEVDDEEVDDEEVDIICPQIMELGKRTLKLQTCSFTRKKSLLFQHAEQCF
jgi:hypothetical protein